jgi:hypothetical protein
MDGSESRTELRSMLVIQIISYPYPLVLKLRHSIPPRTLASKRIDLTSNKILNIKEQKIPFYPLQGSRRAGLLLALSLPSVSEIAAGYAAIILTTLTLRPKNESSNFVIAAC